MPKGKVLVVNDDEELRLLVERCLGGRGLQVVSVRSGEEGLQHAVAGSPDLIIVNADLPGMDGIQTCQEIRKHVYVPIIVISTRSDESDVVLSLGVGADYHLTKPLRPAELVAHVEAAIRRQVLYLRKSLETETVRISDLVLDLESHELKHRGRPVTLSPTEFRLVQALARNVGRIMTRDQLLDSVWDLRADGVYSRTVDVHIGRIRRKIEDDPSQPRYILTVPGLGYKMVNP